MAPLQGASVLQLFPFSWMQANGIPYREDIYSNMAAVGNSSYARWINKRWDHAFLRKCAQVVDTARASCREHPSCI